MLTLREVTKEGFGLKERSWNAKENILQWREAWAEYANKHLALNGIDQRIDHKTLEEQGINLEPQKKIGPDILRVYDTRVEEHQRIAKENGDKILEDPTIALKAITYHQSTFTHQDLARFINRHTIDAEQFQLVYEKVKTSEQIIALTDEQGKERFTTKEMHVLENKMLDDAIELKDSSFIAVNGVYDDPTNAILAPQQQDALNHIIGDGDIKCLIGYAGTGKSRLLGQAKELWEKDGYRVHGATLSGIAAENLEAASGIQSRTLASRCYYWNKGAERLTKKDVLVIDEAGMLGSRQVARVLDEVKIAGAKAVLIGDPQQLQAIEAGAAFRAISEQTGFLELTEIKRQQEPWQQDATKEFALRHTQEAIDLYDQHGCVHLFETQEIAKAVLVEKWNEERISCPDKSQIMLSYTRKDAQELNEMARSCRKENNELGDDQELKTVNGNKGFAINDRIYFLRNDRSLGVKNGILGTIETIDGKQVTVKLDRDDLNGNSKVVTFNLEQYNHIAHGYAATIHKAQGVTVDQSYILASKHLDSHAVYVGMSRHKERADLYWSKEEFADKRELEQVLGRNRSKDVTLDYFNQNTRETDEQEPAKETIEAEKNERIPKDLREKSVSELMADLVTLSGRNNKTQEIETREQSYIREIKELNQKAEMNPGARQLRQELDQLHEQQRQGEQRKREAEERMKTYLFSLRSQEKARQQQAKTLTQPQKISILSPQEKQAAKMVEKYYELEQTYLQFKERGRSRSSEIIAEGDMNRFSEKIYNDKSVMSYVQNHDQELFKKMSGMADREKVLVKEREKERGFELSL
jgi:Ti-type conjugative transfer relaxase TraA